MNITLVMNMLLVVQLLLAVWLMWRSPYNPLSIVGMLTTVFSYLPAVLLVAGSGFESYSWRSFTGMDVSSAVDAAILLGILNLCLLLGGVAAEHSYQKNSLVQLAMEESRPPRGAYLYGSQNLGIMSAAYFFLWLVSALVLYRQSGQTLSEFILPIKKTGIAAEQSGYLRSIYMGVPSALVIMSYWKHGRLRFSGWAWVALALLATFSSHQRRELITTALLILSLGMFLGPLRYSMGLNKPGQTSDPTKLLRRMRLSILGVLLTGLTLVPLLWYTRVYFTSQSRGADVDVFEVRSLTDILLGSPTTGFPTFVYIQRFVADYGTDPFYLLAYPLTIFIPRDLWESKPLDLDSILQSQYLLMENPSSFWYGELFYGFGYSAPIAALLLGFVIYRFGLKCQNAHNIWYRTLGALFFMQCVTLFKNGVTVFLIETLVLVVLLGFAWNVCRPPDEETRSEESHVMRSQRAVRH